MHRVERAINKLVRGDIIISSLVPAPKSKLVERTNSPKSKVDRLFQLQPQESKMIKAVKKLKFWSRKKRKKKTHHLPYYTPPPPLPPPPPPPPHHYCCSCSCSSSSYSTQPSAPPLQPWLEFDAEEYTHDTLLAPELLQPAPQQQESALNSSSSSQLYPNPTSSYQQYMVPNPVYGIPVAQPQAQTQMLTPRETRDRSAGVFGCVVDFGIHLFRCFCPCFRIREVILD